MGLYDLCGPEPPDPGPKPEYVPELTIDRGAAYRHRMEYLADLGEWQKRRTLRDSWERCRGQYFDEEWRKVFTASDEAGPAKHGGRPRLVPSFQELERMGLKYRAEGGRDLRSIARLVRRDLVAEGGHHTRCPYKGGAPFTRCTCSPKLNTVENALRETRANPTHPLT